MTIYCNEVLSPPAQTNNKHNCTSGIHPFQNPFNPPQIAIGVNAFWKEYYHLATLGRINLILGLTKVVASNFQKTFDG